MKSTSRIIIATAAIVAIAQAAPALAGPFTVSSPTASTSSKVKLGMEFKDGDRKDTLALPKIEIGTPITDTLSVAVKGNYRTITRNGGTSDGGLGDVAFKAKWTFLTPPSGASGIALAIEPEIKLPSGKARKGLGNGDTEIALPLIIGYKTGAWELGSELGYSHVFHQDEDAAYLGFLAMRRVSPGLKLGAEVVVETAGARLKNIGTLANIGFKWRMAKAIELSGLAGRTLSTPDHSATNKFKLDLEFKF